MIYLDSASEEDARAASALGYVSGVTTNPKLMASTSREPLDQLNLLLEVFAEGLIFYQPVAGDEHAAADELRRACALAPDRVVCKLPAQRQMVTLASRLTAEGLRCAITGTYTSAQALVAGVAGVDWVIPYVDRARRLRPDGGDLVVEIARVLRQAGLGTRILAASVKSPGQAVRAVTDGADAITAPLYVLESLPEDELTDEAVAEFAAAYRAKRDL